MTSSSSMFFVEANTDPQASDVDRVLRQVFCKRHVAELLRLQMQKSISYSQSEWLPDEYQILMSEGLVKFTYAPYDWAKVVWRIFTLTERGEKWAEVLRSRSMRAETLST